MCLTIPGKIKSINSGEYCVKYETQENIINNSLVEDLKVGDWVIVQNKFIVQHLTNKQAQDFFELLK